MTKTTANSTITKLLLLNVRDLLRQQTCGDAHSQVILFYILRRQNNNNEMKIICENERKTI